MRSRPRFLWPLLATIFVACLTPSNILAAAKPRAERPTYTLGEKWIRDDGIYELVRIEDDRYVFTAEPDREIHLTKDLAIAKVRQGQATFEWNPPVPLAWPLEAGKWGSVRGSWIDAGTAAPANIPATFTWSVEAYESVRVPAGTFPAFRIEVVIRTGDKYSFFAGHGAHEVDQRGLERDGLAKYLIPSDADPEDLYSTALPMDELQTIFARLEAERVVVLLDTCYSGAAGGRTFAALRTRAVNLDELFLERLARTKGRAIITASRPNEVSLEVGEYSHGLFTYYLLQGLAGQADLNRDRIVSLQELYEYVESEVTRTSRALGGNQHPVLKGELEGVLPLVKVSAPRP